jgi:hypothetical protein
MYVQFYFYYGLQSLGHQQQLNRVQLYKSTNSIMQDSTYATTIVYHFFSPIELIYEKGTERVLFKVFFRLYKCEKLLSFLSLDSLSKHRKTQMGPNHSCLGFVKNTTRDSSEG